MRYITLATCVTLPCSCGARNTRCTPTKRKPEKHLLAKRCIEMYGGPRKTKLTVVFRTVGRTIEATLSERFVDSRALTDWLSPTGGLSRNGLASFLASLCDFPRQCFNCGLVVAPERGSVLNELVDEPHCSFRDPEKLRSLSSEPALPTSSCVHSHVRYSIQIVLSVRSPVRCVHASSRHTEFAPRSVGSMCGHVLMVFLGGRLAWVTNVSHLHSPYRIPSLRPPCPRRLFHLSTRLHFHRSSHSPHSHILVVFRSAHPRLDLSSTLTLPAVKKLSCCSRT